MKLLFISFFILSFVACSTSAEQGAAKTLDNANSAIGSVADKIWISKDKGAKKSTPDEKEEDNKK